MHAAQKTKSKLKFATLDEEGNMSTLKALATTRVSENLQRAMSYSRRV